MLGVDLGVPIDAPPEAVDVSDAGTDGLPDATADAPADVDAAPIVDGGSDGLLGPFSAPTSIDAVDYPDANNTDPSMTSDGRELYFVSDRGCNQDLWVSRRDAGDAPWGAPSAVTELDTPMPEQSPGVSFDGLTLWFTRTVMRNQPQIWVTTRTAPGLTWGPPTAVTELDTTGNESSAKVDEDELLMFFVSTRSGSAQVYSTTRPNTQSPWGTPAIVPGLLPAGDVQEPVRRVVRAEALVRNDAGGRRRSLHGQDRTSVTAAAFAPSTPLTELNTPASEVDPALSCRRSVHPVRVEPLRKPTDLPGVALTARMRPLWRQCSGRKPAATCECSVPDD